MISGSRIRASGVRHISDVLRMVPGMEVIRVGAGDANVSLRGYNDSSSAAQGVLVKIDGHDAYNWFYGNTFFDLLPVSLEDIDRIEVIRGPASAVWGPNAMHGFLNIVTMSPHEYVGKDRSRFVSFSTRFGTYNSTLSTLRYANIDRADRSWMRATLVYDDIDRFDAPDDDTRNKAFGTITYHNLIDEDEDHAITLNGSISEQRFHLLLPTLAPIPGPAVYDSDVQESALRADYRLGTLKARGSWVAFDAKTDSDRFYAPFTVDHDAYDLDLQYSFALMPDHFVTIGAGVNHATFSTKDPDVAGGRHATTLVWGFVQDEIVLVDDELFLTLGGRFDEHTRAGNNVSPRAAMVWRVEKKQALRASYSTGFRNPSLRELWFDLPITVPGYPPLSIQGNDNLQAEELRSTELGYTAWFGDTLAAPRETTDSEDPDDTGRLKVGVSLFRNRVSNLVDFENGKPVNLHEDEAFGLEVESKYIYSKNLVTFANYSYTERRRRNAPRARHRLAPRDKANLGFQWESADRQVRVMTWATYFGRTELHQRVVGEHLMVNGSISYHPNDRWSWFLEGFNVLDDNHREHPEGDTYGAMIHAGFRVIL